MPLTPAPPPVSATVPAVATAMSPPLPGPEVTLDIVPPPIDKLPALTLMFPAFPVLREFACDVIPVRLRGFSPLAPIERAPATPIVMPPPLPGPNVVLEMAPLAAMDKLPAFTDMAPALPVLVRSACDAMPVNEA